jgi:hypothetical protein
MNLSIADSKCFEGSWKFIQITIKLNYGFDSANCPTFSSPITESMLHKEGQFVLK